MTDNSKDPFAASNSGQGAEGQPGGGQPPAPRQPEQPGAWAPDASQGAWAPTPEQGQWQESTVEVPHHDEFALSQQATTDRQSSAQPEFLNQFTAQQPAQPQYGYGAPAYAAPAAPTKNWMGITSLVTSLLGISLLGIIFGHLGMSAAKKGEADNKGLAIAGLVLGYLGLVGGVLLIALIALPLFFAQQQAVQDSQAKADAATLRVQVAIYQVDSGGSLPDVSFDGTSYVVGDVTVPASELAEGATLVDYGDGTFCVEVTYDGGWLASAHSNGQVTDAACSLTGATSGTEGGESPAALLAYDVDSSATVIGRCFMDPWEEFADFNYTFTEAMFPPVSCDEEHYGEAYFVGTFQETDQPDFDAMYQTVDDACEIAFEGYVGVGYWDSSFGYDYYYPDYVTWEAGDRQFMCAVTGFGQTLDAPVAGSGL